jgi:hypothetical protein
MEWGIYKRDIHGNTDSNRWIQACFFHTPLFPAQISGRKHAPHNTVNLFLFVYRRAVCNNMKLANSCSKCPRTAADIMIG